VTLTRRTLLATGVGAKYADAALAIRSEASPVIGNVTQSFEWGKIDQNVPPLLGNGDIGGSFDPFSGTTFDELRYGTGATRDIRTLFLTQLVIPDYWVLEDQAAHFLDPRYYRPTVPRRYLTYGAPFNLLLKPERNGFPDEVGGHEQLLDSSSGILRTRYTVHKDSYAIEAFIYPSESLLTYHITSTSAMRFEVAPLPAQTVAPKGMSAASNTRYRDTKNGYYASEPESDLIVLKQVSNVFCPTYAAVSAPGGKQHDLCVLLPPGEHSVHVAIGHQSLGSPREQAVRLARWAAAIGHSGLRARHIAWWQRFWDRSYISVPDRRLQQMWYRSLYYLACCLPRRVKSFSPEGAYGMFPALAGYHPQDSMYHLFAALSSNHPELCRAQVDYIVDRLPMATEMARNVYYLDGARYPWHSTPGLLPYLPGHSNEGYYLHEHPVNGWIVELVRRYLNAQGWDRSLTEQSYPVLREIARFFSSMLTWRGEGLEILYVPSAGQEESGWDANRKNIFDLLVTASWALQVGSQVAERLGRDQDEARRWHEEARRIDLNSCLRADGTYVHTKEITAMTKRFRASSLPSS